MRLNTPSYNARVQALNKLLDDNRYGFLRSYNFGGSGFVDQRQAPKVPKRVLSGLGSLLKSVTPRTLKRLVDKYTRSGQLLAIKRLATFDQNTRTTPSSLRRGVSVHQDIHHHYVCRTAGRCVCKDSDASRPRRRTTEERIIAEQMFLSAKTFIARNAVEILACEQVIVAPSPLNTGTRFDALAKRVDGVEETWALISWKTGGKYVFDDHDSQALQAPHGRKTKAKKKAAELKRIANKEYAKHVAQVMCEAAMLCKEHGIRVETAYIVYLLSSDDPTLAGLPMYRAVQVMGSALEQCEAFWDELTRRSPASKW